MSLFSFLFHVSLVPRCKLIVQISMCLKEWPGRLKCLTTDLDRSDPLTSSRLGKINAVSGSEFKILKFLRTAFLAAKLLLIG